MPRTCLARKSSRGKRFGYERAYCERRHPFVVRFQCIDLSHSYKQNKFNLLREQSEGYSKLTTEITSSLGPPHSPQSGLPAEASTVTESRARPVWEKVISLIGYFDLDPNRALDIILDILSTHLATHYSFFLALLSYSPWAGHRRNTTGSDTDLPIVVDPRPPSYQGMTLDEILATTEAKAQPAEGSTRDGSRVLAQVLGFKFAFYQVCTACHFLGQD